MTLLTAVGLCTVGVSCVLLFFQLWVAGGVLDAWASRENLDELPHYSRRIAWCAWGQSVLLGVVSLAAELRIAWLSRTLREREDG